MPIRAPPTVPIIGLSTMVSAEAIERGRRVGLNDYVAKFDRQGLIAALKEQTADIGCCGVSDRHDREPTRASRCT